MIEDFNKNWLLESKNLLLCYSTSIPDFLISFKSSSSALIFSIKKNHGFLSKLLLPERIHEVALFAQIFFHFCANVLEETILLKSKNVL